MNSSEAPSMGRYVMLVASLGRYRLRTIQEVQRQLGAELTIVAGTQPYDPSIRVLTEDDIPMQAVANYYGPAGILWQRIPWSRVIRTESLITDLNPRVLSGWVILLMRKVLGRRTVLWGHAFPRAGSKSGSDRIRAWMRSLADGLLSYTRTQADELRAAHSMPVYAAPNALYFSHEMGFFPGAERDTVIFVGRLEADKKVSLLLEAFAKAAERIPAMKLIVVGDGAERLLLEKSSAALTCGNRISFTGHIDDTDTLRSLYSKAFVSASPGYVGLSITQSLSFGVPMLIARDERHSPEIEAAQEGENCAYFASDDPEALGQSLVAFWQQRDVWETKGAAIAQQCARDYSVEAMAGGIVAAFEGR